LRSGCDATTLRASIGTMRSEGSQTVFTCCTRSALRRMAAETGASTRTDDAERIAGKSTVGTNGSATPPTGPGAVRNQMSCVAVSLRTVAESSTASFERFSRRSRTSTGVIADRSEGRSRGGEPSRPAPGETTSPGSAPRATDVLSRNRGRKMHADAKVVIRLAPRCRAEPGTGKRAAASAPFGASSRGGSERSSRRPCRAPRRARRCADSSELRRSRTCPLGPTAGAHRPPRGGHCRGTSWTRAGACGAACGGTRGRLALRSDP